MNRVEARRGRRQRGLTVEQEMAIAVAAEAELGGVQTKALLEAADFVLLPAPEVNELSNEAGSRNCVRPEADPEDWFPLISTEIGADHDGSVRLRERGLAQRLCAGCPLRRECLANALGLGVGVGIWGGLGARDRAELVPAWHQLRDRLEQHLTQVGRRPGLTPDTREWR
jgi:WhiB family redox-sensing transcriptional regulator